MDDRAQIAAMALQGIVSSTDEDGLPLAGPNFAAARAVEYADALLEALRLSSKPPPSADKPDPAPPLTGPGNGEAGEPEGAASPNATEAKGADTSDAPARSPIAAGPDPVSPYSVWDCEARLEHAPVCAGPTAFDPVSKGRFCPLHLSAIPESGRRELHRLHGYRNAPAAPVERLAG